MGILPLLFIYVWFSCAVSFFGFSSFSDSIHFFPSFWPLLFSLLSSPNRLSNHLSLEAFQIYILSQTYLSSYNCAILINFYTDPHRSSVTEATNWQLAALLFCFEFYYSLGKFLKSRLLFSFEKWNTWQRHTHIFAWQQMTGTKYKMFLSHGTSILQFYIISISIIYITCLASLSIWVCSLVTEDRKNRLKAWLEFLDSCYPKYQMFTVTVYF